MRFMENPLMGKDKALGLRIGLIVLAASVIASIAIPLLTDITFWRSSALLALPFVSLGYLDLVIRRRWIPLIVSVAVPAVLFVAGWVPAFVALALIPGSFGVSVVINFADRMFLLRMLDTAEHCGASGSRNIPEHLTAFIFGLPADFDARNMFINDHVRRERIEMSQLIKFMAPAVLLLLLLWMFVSASFGLRFDSEGRIVFVTVACLYIAAFSAPWSIFASVDARVVSSGSTFRLFDGFFGTLKRMAVPLAVALFIIAVAAAPGLTALWLALASIAMVSVTMALSLLNFSQNDEPELVSDISAAWSETHPVDFYSGFDGRDGRHPLDDGVPGTPRRPSDACFKRQKN